MAKAQNDADTHYRLAEMYYYGRGVTQDKEQAAKWYGKAAEQGHSDALEKLCEMVEEDISLALRALHRLAEQGNADAQYRLGEMYDNGVGMQVDEERAVEWYIRAFEQGQSDAITELTSRISEESELDFQRFLGMAKQGNTDAQYLLLKLYYHGYGIQKNKRQVVNWCHKNAKNGLVKFQWALGVMYYNGVIVQKDVEKAMRWFGESIVNGKIDGLKILNHMARHGDESAYKEIRRTLEKLRYTAEQGSDSALHILHCIADKEDDKDERHHFSYVFESRYILAKLYYYGIGVQKDKEESVKWCIMAAGDYLNVSLSKSFDLEDGIGNPKAQELLANMYYNGHGVPKNRECYDQWIVQAAYGYRVRAWYGDADAVDRLRQLAESEWEDAQYYLGMLYEHGRGVRKHSLHAIAWYRKAAQQGHKEARKALQRLNKL